MALWVESSEKIGHSELEERERQKEGLSYKSNLECLFLLGSRLHLTRVSTIMSRQAKAITEAPLPSGVTVNVWVP